MLISLLILSPEQIYVGITHRTFYRGPITLLEPLVVLIGRHKDMLVKRFQKRRDFVGVVACWGKKLGELG